MMFGWQGLPWLIELQIATEEHKLDRKLTQEEVSAIVKRLFDATLESETQHTLAMTNLHEADRRNASLSHVATCALVVFVIVLVVALAAG
jgi:uncharacterized membrane-anchored protein